MWEYTLFLDELERGLTKCQQRRKDFTAGVSPAPRRRIQDIGSAGEDIISSLEELEGLISNLEPLFAPSAQREAFGVLGEAGDAKRIIVLAQRVVEVYDSILEWGWTLRATQVPDAAHSVYWTFSAIADDVLNQIEHFVSEFERAIREIREAVLAGQPHPENASLDLVLTLDEQLLAAAYADVEGMVAFATANSTQPVSRSALEPRPIRTFVDAEDAARDYMVWLGYVDATPTSAGRDGGIDVVAQGAVAQVKAHVKPVGAPDVQQLYGVALSMSSRPLFFALSGYTPAAVSFAAENGVCLFTFDLTGIARPANAWAEALESMSQREQADSGRSTIRVERRWVTNIAFNSTIAHSASFLLVRDGDAVHVLDARTGSVTWSQALPGGDGLRSAAAIVGDRVIIAVARILHVKADVYSESSELIGFDAATGGESWRLSVDAGCRMLNASDHRSLLGLVVSPFLKQTEQWMVDASAGRVVWRSKLHDDDIVSQRAPFVADGLAVSTVRKRTGELVVALDLASGSEVWRRPTYRFPVPFDESWGVTSASQDHLFVCSSPVSGSRVHCFALDGSHRWSTSEMFSTPGPEVEVVAGIAATTHASGVVALSMADGTTMWHRPGDVLWLRAFDGGFLVCEPAGTKVILTLLNAVSGQPMASLHADGESAFLPITEPWVDGTASPGIITSGWGAYVTQHTIAIG